MRLFRDDPDEYDINPRPTGRNADRVMNLSSTILAQQTCLRATSEDLSVAAQYPELFEEIRTVATAVESDLNE